MSLLYSEELDLNSKLPEFKLKGTDHKEYTEASFADKKGLLIVFTCNHCPYAKASWPIIQDLDILFPDVQFVAINSNDSRDHPEDSFKGMEAEVENRGIKFPYLHDEDQSVAKAFKAQCTPDPYLYKWNEDAKEFQLFYHGRINDNWQDPSNVKDNSLQYALDLLIKGKQPPAAQFPSMGCSIKWKN